MNTSAGFVSEVPTGVVTVTFSGPADCGGEEAVMVVGPTTMNAAEYVPKYTAVAR
jgi:hypothetical protein